MVEGFYNPSHIIREFIANEYAFSFFFEDREIRVAHHKGIWTFGKIYKNKEETDWFSWGDGFSGVKSGNELTENLAEAIGKIQKIPREWTREHEAGILWKVLEIWAGRKNDIKKISVIQPGRNSYIDEKTLEFILDPRENEFRK